MSDRGMRDEYLYNLPTFVLCEFTRVMDSLTNSAWTRFASRVLSDQLDFNAAARSQRRTGWVIDHWGNRNGKVGELLDLLQELQLLRARDVILSWKPNCRPPSLSTSSPSLPKPDPFNPVDRFTPPPKAPPEVAKTHLFGASEETGSLPALRPLPKPGPPPPDLESKDSKESSGPPQALVTDTSLRPCAMCWPFDLVHQGTRGFSPARQVGEGGFGQVYRATINNTDYAVKRLKEHSEVAWSVLKESFKTEVEKLTQYRHPNIVDFVGYSIEGGTHCLLYVFMPRGSLEDLLHNQSSSALSWSQRVSVLLGSAKGLQFLHSSVPKLIHGDIKSSNILLGEHLEPKLGDFGLARFCRRSPHGAAGKTTSVARTQTVRGTLAYLPEEYLKNGELGVEIDVYSFGVIMLEVLTGRRALETDRQARTLYLKDLVAEMEDDPGSLSTGSLSGDQSLTSAAAAIWKKHLDPCLASAEPPAPLRSLDTAGPPGPPRSLDVTSLACRCLDRRKKKRPKMIEVFDVLRGVHAGLQTFSRAPTVDVASTTPPLSHLDTDSSLDKLTHSLCRLGPQENTYCAPETHGLLDLSCTSGSLGSPPCEWDESQGYSQYTPPSLRGCTRDLPSPSLCLPSGADGDSFAGHSGASPLQASTLLGGVISPHPQGPEESDEFEYLTEDTSGEPINTLT